MEITIKGKQKEISAFVVAIQKPRLNQTLISDVNSLFGEIQSEPIAETIRPVDTVSHKNRGETEQENIMKQCIFSKECEKD